MPIELKEFPNYLIYNNGDIYSLKSGKKIKLKPYLDSKKRYLYVRIFNDKGERKHMSIHKLVALAYLGYPNDKSLEVNHKDRNTLNNDWTNLEWITHQKNIHYSYETMSCVRNYRECKLYKNNIFIGNLKSIAEACRYAVEKYNASYSMLEKHRKYKDLKIIS